MSINEFKFKNWRFSSNQGFLSASAEGDALEFEIGVHPLPEILFPSSVLKIELLDDRNISPKFTLAFTTKESVRFSKFSEVDAFAVSSLAPLQVKDAETWRKSRAATPKLEISHDWTFSTSYQGTLSEQETRENVEISDSFLPYELLRNEKIPIAHFGSVDFWEDELHDNGGCQFGAKFRVTDVYFYILAEYTLNLVGVASRKIQTRYFHVFGQTEVLRETKCMDGLDVGFCKQTRIAIKS